MIDDAVGAALLAVARDAVRAAARERPTELGPTALAALPDAARRPGAAFVTISIRDARGGPWRLRGCIGTTSAERPLAQAVAESARAAALDDPRFPPVTADELPRVRVSVTVLGPLRPVPSADAVDVSRHGVVLERGDRRALFLPQVARDTGWGREELLARLAGKAGLPADAWRDGTLSVFDARSFGAPSD